MTLSRLCEIGRTGPCEGHTARPGSAVESRARQPFLERPPERLEHVDGSEERARKEQPSLRPEEDREPFPARALAHDAGELRPHPLRRLAPQRPGDGEPQRVDSDAPT